MRRNRPPELQFRRNDRPGAWLGRDHSRSGGAGTSMTWPQPPCRTGMLSIADGAPHARLDLLEPATPNPRRQRAPGPYEGTPVRPDGTVDAAEPARLDGRRFGGVGTPPSSRYTAGAGGGIRVAALAGAPPRSSMVAAAPQQCLINGSGCAAASIRGDRLGDASMGTPC